VVIGVSILFASFYVRPETDEAYSMLVVLNVTVFDKNGTSHGSVYQNVQLYKPVDAEQTNQENQSASYTVPTGQYQAETQVADSQLDDSQVNASQVDESQVDDSQNEDSQIDDSHYAQETEAEIYSDSDPNWDKASVTVTSEYSSPTANSTDDDSSTAVAIPAPLEKQ
jgi:hypothetical protein